MKDYTRRNNIHREFKRKVERSSLKRHAKIELEEKAAIDRERC